MLTPDSYLCLMQRSFGLFLLPLMFISASTAFSQSPYPTNYFRSPMDTTISLAGNFGEIRPNHFHAGFDIRTGNREGLPVYAAADGYVSRIKVSPYGYGKALYIVHPNGYTTVYGHLQSFHGNIAAYCKTAQYSIQSFELDSAISASALPVKKGDLIGLSGNTGGSQGPHLHFEVRETLSEMPVNPYFFGYQIADTVKPRITELVVYPLSEDSEVNGKKISEKIAPIYKKGKYTYLPADTVTVKGEIGFGIECYDRETGSTNNNGVYSIELQTGGKRVYYHEMEKFSFENSRYVNAHIDYVEKQKHNRKIQKCFIAKNNKINIYKDVINQGRIYFKDDSIHWIRFIVKDFAGNATELMLKVKSIAHDNKLRPVIGVPVDHTFYCEKENYFNKDDIQVLIPAGALYDDVEFKYDLDFKFSQPTSMKGTYSPLQKVMSDEIALQKAIKLSLKPNRLPDSLQSKSCIVSIDAKGKRTYEGGHYSEGWVIAHPKTFGNFAVAVDTTAPGLRLAFKPAMSDKIINLTRSKTIGITATDNLSGIRKYKASIDDQWVLCEYEMKKDLLFYTFDEKVTPGVHTFFIEVSDDKQNKRTFEFKFKR